MTRVLLLILLVWILYVVIKRTVASSAFKDSAHSTATKAPTNEKIVQCAICGLHVPESESLVKKNQTICNSPDCNSN